MRSRYFWNDDPPQPVGLSCDICGRGICAETETHHGEDYYVLDGQNICEDCVYDYLKKNRKECRI